MEIRVLRYFLTAAREGSITKAAKSLHVSQPTITRQIHTLEEELGQTLFVRTNYHIALTEAGLLMKRRAENILELVEQTNNDFKNFDDTTSGDVYIGGAESYTLKYLADIFKKLRTSHPGIRFHYITGNTEELMDDLEHGLLDFAFILEKPDPAKFYFIEIPVKDVYGVIMRTDSPLASQKSISLNDLQSLPLICAKQGIANDYPKWFGNNMDKLNIVATYDLPYNASFLALNGTGYMLCFEHIIDTSPTSGLCFRPLEPKLMVEMSVIWKRYQVFSPVAELLHKELLKFFSKQNI